VVLGKYKKLTQILLLLLLLPEHVYMFEPKRSGYMDLSLLLEVSHLTWKYIIIVALNVLLQLCNNSRFAILPVANAKLIIGYTNDSCP
jgi:hypothetical protein